LGVRIKETYWTIGPYDIVSIGEAPDDETMTAEALAISGEGERPHDHASRLQSGGDACDHRQGALGRLSPRNGRRTVENRTSIVPPSDVSELLPRFLPT